MIVNAMASTLIGVIAWLYMTCGETSFIAVCIRKFAQLYPSQLALILTRKITGSKAVCK